MFIPRWEEKPGKPYHREFSTSTNPYGFMRVKRMEKPTIDVYDNGKFIHADDLLSPCRSRGLTNGVSSFMIRQRLAEKNKKKQAKKESTSQEKQEEEATQEKQSGDVQQ